MCSSDLFGIPFLNTCSAVIDFKKEKVSVQFAGEPYEFNISKFARHHYEKELPSEDLIIERIDSIAMPPNDPFQQFMEEHGNDMFM